MAVVILRGSAATSSTLRCGAHPSSPRDALAASRRQYAPSVHVQARARTTQNPPKRDISALSFYPRGPRIHPITISRALQVKASTRVHRLCSNLHLKRAARFVGLNLICALLCLCDRLRKGISKASVSLLKPSSQGLPKGLYA